MPGLTRVRELLVVELLGGLGDLLLALPAVHALARAQPGAAVRVLTFEPGAQLLRNDPHVAEVVAIDDHGPGAARTALERQLDRRPADVVISTTAYDGIAELIGSRVEHSVTNLWRDPPADELVDLRFLRLLHADGLVRAEDLELPPRVWLTESERQAGALLADELLGRRVDGLLASSPVLLLPDAGMPIKRWPELRWHELARRIGAAGRSAVVLSRDRPELSDALRSLAGALVVPPLPLREVAALAAALAGRGGVAVVGDTGPGRLAAAVGLPVVSVFGPTAAARYGLRSPVHVNLQGLPGCEHRRPAAITEQCCWWSGHCPLDSTGPACMAAVSVDEVVGCL